MIADHYIPGGTVVLPQPTMHPNWESWAAALLATLPDFTSNMASEATQAGILPIVDSLGRVVVDSSGIYAFNAAGANPISPNLFALDTQDLVDAAIATAKLQDLAVTEGKLGDLSVATAKIQLLAVDSAQIANAAILSAKIGDLQVITAKIDNLAVNTAKIANLAVGSGQIDNLAVINAKIGLLAVDTAQIQLLAVDTAQIALLAVEAAQINALAVTEAKIDDLAVTEAKIGALAVIEAKIGALAVTEAKIGALAVTQAKIGLLAVDSAQIANAAIGTAKIGDLEVTTIKITNGAITNTATGSGGTVTLDGTWKNVASASITPDSVNSNLQVFMFINWFTEAGEGQAMTTNFRLKRGSTIVVADTQISDMQSGDGQLADHGSYTDVFTDSGQSGSTTYNIEMTTTGTEILHEARNCTLFILETKK